jgi:hypothetical protein
VDAAIHADDSIDCGDPAIPQIAWTPRYTLTTASTAPLPTPDSCGSSAQNPSILFPREDANLFRTASSRSLNRRSLNSLCCTAFPLGIPAGKIAFMRK